MKAGRSWLLNGLLIVASLGLTLVAAELAVRTFFPQPTGVTHQDRYGLPLHYPGITRYFPQYGHAVSFNAAGMRDREHPLAKPAGVYRILLLGDSFMEALQVPFEASFPSLLERRLSELTDRPVEVINAGVGGWGQDDELRYLTSYGMRYHPDLILVAMTLHNDVSDNLRRVWHTVRDGALVEQPVYPASFLRFKVVQIKAWLSTRFQLYQLWRRARHGGEIRQAGRQLSTHVHQLFRSPTPPRIEQGLDLTTRLLAALRDSAQAGTGRMAVVLLPIRYQLADSTFARFVESSDIPLTQMELRRPQDVILRAGDSLGIPVIDLLPGFREWTADSSGPLFLEQDGHWDVGGHHLAAEIAARGLITSGVVPNADRNPVVPAAAVTGQGSAFPHGNGH